MATKKDEKVYFDLASVEWSVTNVRALEWGTFFTLNIPGLALFDLRVVPGTKKYDAFIGMPEIKGKDGNYYKRYAIYLNKEDTEAVLDAVEEALEEEDPKSKKRK